jgi:glycosyltransferase involved in cell wall biosynthesis
LLGVFEAIRFVGFLDMAGKAREGSLAEVFLNTNRIDNMPVSVVEACAMGIPVVSTAVGGVPDLLQDGETGLLVPDDDDGAMAAAVKRLLRDPVLAGRLSLNGRQLAESCSWEAVRPQWEEVIRTAAGRSNTAQGGQI